MKKVFYLFVLVILGNTHVAANNNPPGYPCGATFARLAEMSWAKYPYADCDPQNIKCFNVIAILNNTAAKRAIL